MTFLCQGARGEPELVQGCTLLEALWTKELNREAFLQIEEPTSPGARAAVVPRNEVETWGYREGRLRETEIFVFCLFSTLCASAWHSQASDLKRWVRRQLANCDHRRLFWLRSEWVGGSQHTAVASPCHLWFRAKSLREVKLPELLLFYMFLNENVKAKGIFSHLILLNLSLNLSLKTGWF